MIKPISCILGLSLIAGSAACGSSSDTPASDAGGGNASAGAPTSDGGRASVPSGGAPSGGTPSNSAAGSGTSGSGATSVAGGAGSSGSGSIGGALGSGGAASGGSSAHGGAAGSGGASGNGGAAMCGNVASTATRPQLTSAQAANDTIAKYLAGSDGWDPTSGLANPSGYTANVTVAADGSSSYTTLQAGINAAATGSARRYIQIKPGTYRGKVSYTGNTPLTVYATETDATRVVIVNSQSASDAGGTPKSATFMSSSPGLQLLNLTVSNDFATPSSGSNIQAVALYVTGDKTVLENVRLHGFQDTLYADTASDTNPSRVYIRNSFIEGDTDFIFGAARLVIDSSDLHYLSSRKGSGSGVYLAPSTRVANDYGFLVIASKFSADASAPSSKISLGRSWDQGGVSPTPNGQAVVRESTLGAHISKTAPWAAAATSGRAFSATGNRFAEYCNSGTGAAP